jgi:hypothetical protein
MKKLTALLPLLLLLAACSQKLPEMSDNVQVRIDYPGTYFFSVTSKILTTEATLTGNQLVNLGYPKYFFVFIARKDRFSRPMTVSIIDKLEKRTVYSTMVRGTNEDIHFYGSKASGEWKFSK